MATGVGLMAILIALAACGDSGPPAAGPYPETRPSRVVEAGEVPFVEHATPAESLFVRRTDPSRDVRLLFYRGRGVSHDQDGSAYVPDAEASRVLVIGPDLVVRRTVGGPSEETGRVGLPLSVAATPEGGVYIVDVEHPQGLLYFDPSGRFVGASSPPVINGYVRSGPDAMLWAARSPYILGFEPTESMEPLLWRFDPLAGEGAEVARIEPVGAPTWNRLANAGPVTVGPDGTAFFAFLLRNELRAYTAAGHLKWRVRRALPFDVPELVVEMIDDTPRIPLRPVNQAMTVGPDGLLYVLTAAAELHAPGQTSRESRRRVEAYDPESGELLRASAIPDSWVTLAVDAAGRLYSIDADALIASAPAPERATLPDVTFESFEGRDASFAEYRGRALLVNFWASWCVPCREELPRLKAYYETLDRDRVEFLAISEDEDPEAARAFAAEFDLPFPLFLGHGELHELFRYIGLPYTLIVDYRGRIVETIYGFGSEETWDRLTSLLEAEMGRAAPGEG